MQTPKCSGECLSMAKMRAMMGLMLGAEAVASRIFCQSVRTPEEESMVHIPISTLWFFQENCSTWAVWVERPTSPSSVSACGEQCVRPCKLPPQAHRGYGIYTHFTSSCPSSLRRREWCRPIPRFMCTFAARRHPWNDRRSVDNERAGRPRAQPGDLQLRVCH